jgi:AraC family transcriptional regulator
MEQPFSSFRRQSLEVPGLVISSAWFAPSLHLGRHYHERASVSVILHGGYDTTRQGSPMRCEAGTVVLTPAAEPHQNVFVPMPTQMLVVELKSASAAAPVRLDSMPDPAIVQLARRAALEMEALDELAPLACEGLALEVLAGALRLGGHLEPRPPVWLRQIRDRMNDAPDRPASISALAAAAGVGRTRLIHAFRHHYRTTPAAYLRKLRVEQAARMLSDTDEPIAAVAVTCGFSDQSHLNRVFKRELGCTPAAFRSGRT